MSKGKEDFQRKAGANVFTATREVEEPEMNETSKSSDPVVQEKIDSAIAAIKSGRSEKKMKIYISKFSGLKLVVRPKTSKRNEFGDKVTKEGRYIKFSNGKFATNDPEDINFLNDYVKRNNGIVFEFDEGSQEIVALIKQYKGQGKQGPVTMALKGEQ